MLNCNLRIIMAKGKLNINQVVEITGLSQPTVSKLYNNEPQDVKTVKLETINKLCAALECQPGDLIEYMSD
ncbi:MAG TPA: helix-turn-helix transcriptional regulator [Clostridiaceae bacterium]|nr:helix-turn-helix transcriptional regulator [Clostridiaceae bacterium]